MASSDSKADVEDAARSLLAIFEDRARTPQLTPQVAARTVSGLINTKPEDPKAPAGEQLNWWQASNVHKIGKFLRATEKERHSEGMMLCDAPGLGKTLSVLASVASTMQHDDRLVIIFAGKGIIDNVWVEQISRHFDPVVSGLEVFCADSEKSKHEFAKPISTRVAGAVGGVYVDERPTARLPDSDVLRSFRVLVLAKEMLSQQVEPEDNKPLTNLYRIKQLQLQTRLVVVDESHNLNKRSISRQEISLLSFSGIPKLLLSGTPGTTPGELYRLLRIVKHKSLFIKKAPKGRPNRAELAAAAAGVQAADHIILPEVKWRGQYFEAKSDLVLPRQLEKLVELLTSCVLYSPESVWPSKLKMSVQVRRRRVSIRAPLLAHDAPPRLPWPSLDPCTPGT